MQGSRVGLIGALGVNRACGAGAAMRRTKVNLLTQLATFYGSRDFLRPGTSGTL